MARAPQQPDVVERGGYSKEGNAGPTADSQAWETGTPLGHERREGGTSSDPASASVPSLPSRQSLSRGGTPGPAAPRRRLNLSQGGLIRAAIAVLCSAVLFAAAMAWFMLQSDPEVAQPVAPPAPVEAPTHLGNIPVKGKLNGAATAPEGGAVTNDAAAPVAPASAPPGSPAPVATPSPTTP